MEMLYAYDHYILVWYESERGKFLEVVDKTRSLSWIIIWQDSEFFFRRLALFVARKWISYGDIDQFLSTASWVCVYPVNLH